jgi:DNA polymerase III epsilon subunit-like protein|tara:strand:- start:3992 stop:4615 length:624 start_codon:yes stop_codon:yes gene_type:complete
MDKNANLVFIDFETFNVNLNFFSNRPWQVAMLKVKKGQTADSFDEMIKWDCDLSISEEAKKITNFSQKKFDKTAKHESEVFDDVYNWLDSCDYIVGHNILGFDMYLMRGWCKIHNKPYNHFFEKSIDTLSIARGLKSGHYFKEQESPFFQYQYKMLNFRKKGMRTSLGELGKYYSIEHDSSKLHDALNDLYLNLGVWKKLKLEMDRI